MNAMHTKKRAIRQSKARVVGFRRGKAKIVGRRTNPAEKVARRRECRQYRAMGAIR